MVAKTESARKAFARTKEERSRVVNFKDCRPRSQFSASVGQVGFVKHVGDVKYIEKSNLKVEVKNQRTRAQIADTDEFQLKVLVEDQVTACRLIYIQREMFEQLVQETRNKFKEENARRDCLLDRGRLRTLDSCLVEDFKQDLQEQVAQGQTVKNNLEQSQKAEKKAAEQRIEKLRQEKQRLIEERELLLKKKDDQTVRLTVEVRKAFGQLHKKQKQIAVEEKGRDDKHQWNINNIKDICSKQMGEQNALEEMLTRETSLYKQKSKDVIEEARGQKKVMRHLKQEVEKGL